MASGASRDHTDAAIPLAAVAIDRLQVSLHVRRNAREGDRLAVGQRDVERQAAALVGAQHVVGHRDDQRLDRRQTVRHARIGHARDGELQRRIRVVVFAADGRHRGTGDDQGPISGDSVHSPVNADYPPGRAAECIIAGVPDMHPTGCEDDYEKADELLPYVATDKGTLEAETAALVAENRAAIEAVAQALFGDETLDPDEQGVIISSVDEGDD